MIVQFTAPCRCVPVNADVKLTEAMLQVTDLVRRADELLAMGKGVLGTTYSTGGHYNVNYVKAAPMAGFRSAVLSFLERCFGKDHPYYHEFKEQAAGEYLSNAENGLAILQAVRNEIAGGWLFTIKNLVAAELFADFISMAEHLLDSGYKDPAAVVAGSVLEEHLRQLSSKNSLPIEDDRDGDIVPRKADRLNAELAKANVYSKLDQKLVTAWLDLRNNAAHGKYEAYASEQVDQMIQGVVEFMARKAL